MSLDIIPAGLIEIPHDLGTLDELLVNDASFAGLIRALGSVRWSMRSGTGRIEGEFARFPLHD